MADGAVLCLKLHHKQFSGYIDICWAQARYHCCVPFWEGLYMSLNMVFFLIFLLSISLLCSVTRHFFLCNGEQGKCMHDVYTDILSSFLYSAFLSLEVLRSFFLFQFGFSKQFHISISHSLFKFSFKHLTEKVLIILLFQGLAEC